MCKYCKTDDHTENILEDSVDILHTDIFFELFLNETSLRLCSSWQYNKPLAEKKISYCPMCGRKLTA